MMQTLKLKAKIDSQGILKIEVPTGLSAGDVEIVLVIQTSETPETDANGWPLGFFERTYGILADDPIERVPNLKLEDWEI